MEGGDRFVGVAVDFSACSKKALKWAIDNIIRKGDTLILVTVRPEGHYEESEMQLWVATGSRSYISFIPLSELCDGHTMKRYGVNPDPETLEMISLAARQMEITVVMKIFWGDAREKLCEAIDRTPLSCLVIGNRGLGKIKRAIMGSVSNYVVNNATCPVTVVKKAED